MAELHDGGCHSGGHPFYTPRFHPGAVDVNVRCLAGDVLDELELQAFGGANGEDAVRGLDGP